MKEIKARPTLYKGIQMRSRLEADYAAFLDRKGWAWEYEPTCFAGPGDQWLPDFRLTAYNLLIEVKPAGPMTPGGTKDYWDLIDHADQILARMSIAWLSDPNVQLQLTFWSYGADAPDLEILGHPGQPWLAASHGGFPLLWYGMGQTDTIKERNLPGETLRRLNGLPESRWHHRKVA